jgi:hypothetical protein
LCVEIGFVSEGGKQWALSSVADFFLLTTSLHAAKKNLPDPVKCLEPRVTREQASQLYGRGVSAGNNQKVLLDASCLIEAVSAKLSLNNFGATGRSITDPETEYRILERVRTGESSVASYACFNPEYSVTAFYAAAANHGVPNAAYLADSRGLSSGLCLFTIFAVRNLEANEEVLIDYGPSNTGFSSIKNSVSDGEKAIRLMACAMDKVHTMKHMFSCFDDVKKRAEHIARCAELTFKIHNMAAGPSVHGRTAVTEPTAMLFNMLKW